MKRRDMIKRWKVVNHTTTSWHLRISIWRYQIHWTVHQHHYGTHTSDRWVLQSSTVYDRKAAP